MKKTNNYFVVDPWKIIETKFDKNRVKYSESILYFKNC